jgi:pseudouridine synthase
VRVNGRVARIGDAATADDDVRVDGRPIPRAPQPETWVLHKPVGYVSTAHDPEGRPTARSLVPSRTRLFNVGRLDLNAEGLLLFTNDGELANRLMHPRYGVKRVYRVRVRGIPDAAKLQRLRHGIVLEDGPTGPVEAAIERPAGSHAWLLVTLREGRNREVRRIFEAIGHPVARLIRVAYGAVRLGPQPVGSSRRLSPQEAAALRPRRARSIDANRSGPRS